MTLHTPARTFAGASPAADFGTALPVTLVYLLPGRFDRRRGLHYSIRLGSPDGEQIVTDALDAEFAACRVLVARGVSGRLEIWRPGTASRP